MPLRILISAGPTREPLDPVRFISNRSSGKMGYALAESAVAAGHSVILVSGPVHLAPPRKAKLISVETAAEMRNAMLNKAGAMDLIIMVAAVADYQPSKVSRHKIKKSGQELLIRLKKTPDILAQLGKRKTSRQTLVGFAAETQSLLKNAGKKLKAKNLDFIVANEVGKTGSGFESDFNQVKVLSRNGDLVVFPRMSKKKLAAALLKLFLKRKKG